MSVSELSKYIFASKYARWIPEKKRRENWQETVLRIKSMMIEKYKEKIDGDKSILDDIEWAYSLMNDKWLVGSQRTTQFAGPAIFKHFLRGYNCSATYVDRLRVFQEIMYVLLAGCGAGFSVQRHHVEKLPKFSTNNREKEKIYQIPDSIEGWADSIGILLSSYFNDPIFPEYSNTKVIFDFSQIRSKGSSISSCNGKAPGPAPLKKALDNIEKLLNKCLSNSQSELRPIDAHDLICHIADSVLSGGVRRAALISLFSIDDEEMLKCKTGSWFYDNSQRGRANNSAVLLRNKTSFAQFQSLIKYTKEYGEPGFLWVDSLEQLTNPCFRGNTKILVNNPKRNSLNWITIKDLHEVFDSAKLQVLNIYNEWCDFNTSYNGIEKLYSIEFSNGKTAYCTKNHKWPIIKKDDNNNLVIDEYVMTFELKKDMKIIYGVSGNEIVKILNVCETELKEKVYNILVYDDSNTYHTEFGVSRNCGEISLTGIDEITDQTGWQTCNLSSINGKKITTKEEFLNCCKAAAIIGTLQAGFDEFPYLGNISENIIKREALLGVSICGIMDRPEILLDPEIQKEGAKLVVKTNEAFAKKLGINPASRCTTVKPDGTVSLLFKSASGIHPNHARRYFRRVQANKLESIYQHFKKTNTLACEKCTNTNNDDEVITFCIEVEKGAKLKNDVNAIQLLEAVKLTQNNWIKYGTNNKRLVKPYLRHNVSNTVTVKEDEWEDVTKYIYENRDSFAGISLLPNSGDLDYPAAPFTAIHTPKEILEKYGDSCLFVSGLIVKGLEAFDNNLWKACDAALGIGENLEQLKKDKEWFDLQRGEYLNESITTSEKIDWIEDMIKFAGRYMEGNIRKLTYLIKEVHNWKYWQDLQREYKKVNYEECIEESDNTKFGEEVACSGGSCEIIRT